MAENYRSLTDGDTFDQDEHKTVRVHGVDTPENTPRSGMQPGGWQATEATRAFLRDGHTLGPQTGETYGRDVHEVFDAEGNRLSDQLIRNGLGNTTGFSDRRNHAASALGVADELMGRSSGNPEFELYKESARAQRSENLSRFMNGEFDSRTAAVGYDYLGEQDGTFSRGIDRGVAQLKMTNYAFMDALGEFVDSDTLRGIGREGIESAMLEAARNPANIASWEDVDGAADVGMFMLEAGISEIPSLIQDALIGLTTGGGGVVARRTAAGVGKAFLRKTGGANAAARARDIADGTFSRMAGYGAGASMYGQSTGETHMQQQSVGEDNGGRALLVGAGKTVLDYASFKGILGDVTKRFKDGESVDSIGKWFGATLGTMAVSGGREGVTEMTQALVDELNKVDITDGGYSIDPNRLIEGLVAGTAVGGSLGGAGAAAGNTFQLFANSDATAGDGPVQEDTDPDAPQDLEATIEANPDGIAYASPSNVRDGVTEAYLREKFPNLHVKRTDNGGLKASLSAEAIAKASTSVDETTQAQELGFKNTKTEVMDAYARGEEVAVDRHRDARNRIVREEMVIVEPGVGPAPGVERVSIEQNKADREERYRKGVEAARGELPTQQDVVAEGGLPENLRSEPTRIDFDEDTLPPDAVPLVNEAADLGIDPSRYVVERDLTDKATLTRQLQGMLRNTLPDDPNTTLRDALNGRRLSDLDLAQLEQVARAMKVKDLPKKAKGFRGTDTRTRAALKQALKEQRKAEVAGKDLDTLPIEQLETLAERFGVDKQAQKRIQAARQSDAKGQRNIAAAGVAAKLLGWKQNKRAAKSGRFKPAPVPGDMAVFGQVLPETASLKRTDFSTKAEYQNAVRDAMPSMADIRKRVAGLDDSDLAQSAQLLGVEDVNLAFEQSEGVDTEGLRAAVEQTKMRGEGGSRNTMAEAFPASSTKTPQRDPRTRRQDDFQATPEGAETAARSFGASDRMAGLLRRATETDSRPEYTPRKSDETAQMQAAESARRAQLGQESAARQESQSVPVSEDTDPFDTDDAGFTSEELGVPGIQDTRVKEAGQAAAATALFGYLTGQTSGPGVDVVRSHFAPSLTLEDRNRLNSSVFDGAAIFRSIAANSGRYSPEAQAGLMESLRNIALESPTEFAEGITLPADLSNLTTSADSPARFETASASGVSNTRIQERSEQESSDTLFFTHNLEGARFQRNESGAFQPVREVQLASESPQERQRVKSVERTRRLKGRNLNTLKVRTVLGVEQDFAFDMIALAEYGQAGLRKAVDASSALLNLNANLQRMISGPESSGLLPGGNNPSFVQSLRSDYFINDDTVIFEGDTGPVTYGEAVRAETERLSNAQESTALGNELETLGEEQAAIRKALTQLVGRIANSLGNLAPDARAATLLDIGAAIRNIDSMPGDTSDVVAGINETVARLEEISAKDAALLTADFQKSLNRLEAERDRYLKPSSAEHTNPIQMATQQSELAYVELQEAIAAKNVYGESVNKPDSARLAYLQAVYDSHLDRLADAKATLTRLESNIASTNKLLQRFAEGRGEQLVSEAVDLGDVDRSKSIAGRFSLTETEASNAGLFGLSQKGQKLGVDIEQELGGAVSFRVLADRYSAGIGRAVAINNRLNKVGRSPSDRSIGVDALAAQLMREGYQYDHAYAEAEKLAQVTWGMAGQEGGLAEDRAKVGDEAGSEYIAYGKANEPARGDFTADGVESQAYVDESGELAVAEVQDDAQEKGEQDEAVREDDPLDVIRTTVIPNRARVFALKQRIKEFADAGGKIDVVAAQRTPAMALKELYSQQAPLHQTWVDGDATHVFQNTTGFASEAHKAAFQRHQARKRVQASGTPIPETPRANVLNAAFGEEGLSVVGASDPTAVQAFVTQAVGDFRSTGRPVLVMVGQNADQISRFLGDKRLLKTNQRSSATRKLRESGAGTRAMYMPMGDFVLVSLPAMPKRGRAASVRWYHQLGHELGHMVFDDYAHSLANNRSQREALFAAYTNQTGLDPRASEALFKEWFADQAANEMIERAIGMADPEQVTPFTRLGELMRGLWERIQHLLPRFTRTRAFAEFANQIRQEQIARSRGLSYAELNTHYKDVRGRQQERVREARERLAEAEVAYQEGGVSKAEFLRLSNELKATVFAANEIVSQAAKKGRERKFFAPTSDFAVENYNGPPPAAVNAKMKNFAKKHTAPGTVAEAGGRLVRTVVGRIESYSPELASHLFQRSATDRNSRNQAAWQQAANSNRDRWTGVMETAFQKVYDAAGIKGAFKGKEKQAALTEAFRDFEAGRTHKRGAAALAEVMRAITSNARQNGFRSAVLDPTSPPAAFDHMKVDADRKAFSDLLRETFPDATDHELGKRLELLLDSQGHSEFAIAPGLPVSYHDTTRRMIEVIGTGRLREAGFLTEPSDAVFYHFIDGLAKRTAWEANFGDYSREVTDHMAENRKLVGRDDPNNELVNQLGLAKDGRYYNPNGQFNRMMDAVVAEHGQEARRDVIDMLDGVMGRKTSNMPRGLRNINDWVTAWVSWTVLAFSGIASLPELGLGAVRSHGRVGIMDGVRGVAEARRFAKAAGVVMTDSAERIMWQSMGDSYESSTLNKIGSTFFKYNGQKVMTDTSRILGISFGTQYLLRSAEMGDTQALAQLGVTAEDVRSWDAAGRPTWTADGDPSVNANAEKVQSALNQFMYESSSYPSKFQNPGWFNNPYFKAFWMIKRYMYAYGEGILLGMWRQAKRQWVRGSGLRAEQKAFLAAAPFLAFAVATIPLAAVGTELREWMRPLTTGRPGKDIDDYGGVGPYAQYLFSRSGGFGPLEMVLSMRQQADWGYSLLGSTSPVLGKLEMLTDWGADGSLSGGEALTKARQMTPFASQFPGVWNKVFN